MKTIFLLLILCSQTIFAIEIDKDLKVLIDLKKSGVTEMQSLAVLWNSVAIRVNKHIHCHFLINEETKIGTMDYCYEMGTVNLFTFSAAANYTGLGKYKVISKDRITYNAKTCKVYMGDEVIGFYYAGHCVRFRKNITGHRLLWSTEDGFRIIKAHVSIDTENREMIID